MHILIVDPNIKLKPLQDSDAAALFGLIERNRLYFGKYLPWVASTARVEDSRDFIQQCHQERDAGSTAAFGIFFRGELVGHLSLTDIVPGHKAVVGY